MSEKLQKIEETKDMDFEAKQNFVGFYALLFKIDKRNNPQFYKRNENYEDNGNSNNAD